MTDPRPIGLAPSAESPPSAPQATGLARPRAMVLRAMRIVAILGLGAARTILAALGTGLARGPRAGRRSAYRGLVRTLQTLGPTFVKFGQIAATRTDALPVDLCHELARLHDAVTPMSPRAAELVLSEARASAPALADVEVELVPVGSGSIACVYKGRLPNGELVAVKLKRPGIDRRMRCDLGLLEVMTRAAQRLPKLRGMPMADLVGYVSRAILGQLDFERELRHLAAIRASLEGMEDVRVPASRPDLSTPDCLVFEFLSGLDKRAAAAMPPAVRSHLAGVALAAVGKLFFVDGLVHCDLHPGNLYVTAARKVVILDAGYCVRLPDDVRSLIAEFFARLAVGDGRRCGEIVLESAVNVSAKTDTEGFVSDFAELVAGASGSNDCFDMPAFGDAVYELQQRHGIYAASDFAFPLMSLLVVEGTAREIWPDVDFQMVGAADRGSTATVSNVEEVASSVH